MYETKSLSDKAIGLDWVKTLTNIRWPRKQVIDHLIVATNNPDYGPIEYNAIEIINIVGDYGLSLAEIEAIIQTNEGMNQAVMLQALELVRGISD